MPAETPYFSSYPASFSAYSLSEQNVLSTTVALDSLLQAAERCGLGSRYHPALQSLELLPAYFLSSVEVAAALPIHQTSPLLATAGPPRHCTLLLAAGWLGREHIALLGARAMVVWVVGTPGLCQRLPGHCKGFWALGHQKLRNHSC